MKNFFRHKWARLLLCLVLCCVLGLTACQENGPVQEGEGQLGQEETAEPQDNGVEKEDAAKFNVELGRPYSAKDEVAAYIHQFESLPPNFITKGEARDAGWDNAKGNLWEVTDHKSIGGDYFGNREGLLPEAAGRKYYECDVNYSGGYRGSDRIVYSSDGLIFFTADHYQTFQQLY